MAFVVLLALSTIMIQDGNPALEKLVGSVWTRVIGGLLLVCCYFLVWMENIHLAKKMRNTMVSVNLTLAPLGYRVTYQVEATGDLWTDEHRIYVFDSRPNETPRSSLEIVRRLPPSYESLPNEPVTVYLFASWHSHWCSWPLGFGRPPFFQEGRPPNLGALSNVLWGGLHASLHVPELTEGPEKILTILVAFVIVLVMLTVGDEASLLWFLFLFVLVFAFCMYVYHCILQDSLARKQQQGDARWPMAVAEWQDIYNQAGWTLEYHAHLGTRAIACCVPSNAMVRFIPMRPTTSATLV
jgi:hypothetical protein